MDAKSNKTSAASLSVKDRLSAALGRLEAGKPTHPELIKAAKLGRLRPWSPTVLALESGVSKKSFDRKGSNHQWAWQKQQELKELLRTSGKPTDTPRSTTEINRRLRERVKLLEAERNLLLAQNAALVRRLQSVDGETARELRQRERLIARQSRPNAEQTPASGATVVALHPAPKS